jgi:hypothetical protein
MSVFGRIWEHFVIPAGEPRQAGHEDFVARDEAPERACADSPPRMPPGIAVLSMASDAAALGGALGLVLARRGREPVVAVCLWTDGCAPRAVWRAPALPAARRMAAALAARGHDVRPAARLALVLLPASEPDAAAQARRAAAAAGPAPTVLALGGPRGAAFDALLAEQDLVVVATRGDADPALAQLALDGLAGAAVRACLCEVPPAHPARSLAAAGVALLPSARRALASALSELP